MKKGHGHIFSQFAWYGSGKTVESKSKKQPVSFEEGRRTHFATIIGDSFSKFSRFNQVSTICSDVVLYVLNCRYVCFVVFLPFVWLQTYEKL